MLGYKIHMGNNKSRELKFISTPSVSHMYTENNTKDKSYTFRTGRSIVENVRIINSGEFDRMKKNKKRHINNKYKFLKVGSEIPTSSRIHSGRIFSKSKPLLFSVPEENILLQC